MELPSSNVALNTVVACFLRVTGQISQAATSVHANTISRQRVLVDRGFARGLSAELIGVIDRFDAAVSDLEDGAFARACHKVGGDLLVHLDRFICLQAIQGKDDVDVATFRSAWPHADVEALVSRLHELTCRWKESCPTFDGTDEFLSQAFSLTKIGAIELKTEMQLDKNHPNIEVDAHLEHAATSELSAGTLWEAGKLGSPQAGVRPRHAPINVLEDFILDSLAYKSMRNREEDVTEAHRKTFEWIFRDDEGSTTGSSSISNHFTTWLTTAQSGPIYWINGKPGSGKSTLMRFLFEHKATAKHLKQWAGDLPVTKAGFFFWTSGSKEQRSQTGLLRYLIHQLLSSNREMMATAFPNLWQSLLVMTTKERIKLSIDWTIPELMEGFNSLLNAALQHTNICLFIDGLDEFDGDHRGIINFFKSIGEGPRSTRIKMCLSSRPWEVFERAFQYSIPSLRLQDLTYEDIRTYTKDRLSENVHVRRLFKKNAEVFTNFVEETVRRANGAFLWVRLAVDRILHGFRPGHGIKDLRTVLQALPSELDDLFEKLIFTDQEASQIPETADIFQLIHAREVVADFIKDETANSLTVWELAFALDESDDSPALGLAVEEVSVTECHRRCEMTLTRIHERFAGLLDIFARGDARSGKVSRFSDEESHSHATQSLAQHKLTYIHRTVRDWLMSANAVRGRLVNHSPQDFDPHLRLVRSYVLRLKLPLEEPERHRRLDEWWPDIALALTHARHIHRDPSNLQRPLLNELDRTLSWYWLPKPQDQADHWARNAFGSYEVRMKAPPIENPFLCLTAKFSLTRYVREELEERRTRQPNKTVTEIYQGDETHDTDEDERNSTPLLSYATEFLCSRQKTIYPLSDPDLVEYLLTNPSAANPGPNHPYIDFYTHAPTTPWLALLCHLRTARRRGWIEYYDIDLQGTARWAAIVRMFVKLGGADTDAIIVENRFDPEISALGVIDLLEETYGAVEMRDLRDTMNRIAN
ncbi:hypothetical protein B7463_g12099, partial [Scytalidium lignicola]